MIKKILPTVIVLSVILASGCGNANISDAPVKILRNQPAPLKEVEVFDLAKDTAGLSFYKTGIAKSENEVFVTPETSGRVTQINVEVGDEVNKGGTLVVLGDSASTQIADIQSDTANKSLQLAKDSQNLTDSSTEINWQMAYLGTEAAQKSLANSAIAKRDADAIYEEQLDSAEIALEIAEYAYDSAKDAYDSIRDMTPEEQAQMGGTRSVKISKKSAKSGEEQAENAIDILEKTFISQTHQLDYAIEMALISYKNALNQLQAAQIAMGQQKVGAATQVLQAESGSKIANISSNLKYIKAPISGTVTSISATEGNFAAPGSTLIKLENTTALSLTVAVNSYEKSLIETGDKVTIESDYSQTLEGQIISISPSLDSTTKKINVEILIENPQSLTPGSIVKAIFNQHSKKGIFIPLNSIYNGDEGQYVKVAEEGKIIFKKVSMGQITGDYVEILAGLNGTEKIVTSSELFLDEGEKVKTSSDQNLN